MVADVVQDIGAESVLDVGCGFADAHDYLRRHGWHGSYQGIDVVPVLVAAARERVPGIHVDEADIDDYRLGDADAFDVVFASGVFNERVRAEAHEIRVERAVRHMFRLARRAVCIDFMSTLVDFRRPETWHADFPWVLGLAGSLSRRFVLRHDYLPFEFALVLYKDDSHTGSVFTAQSGRR